MENILLDTQELNPVTLEGDSYDSVEETSIASGELYSWIGDGDGDDQGNGTDYTSIIQNKINELKTVSKGGTVYLGNGTYHINDSLILYSNIKVVGTGKTVINQRTANKHAVVWSGSYISMQGLTIKLSGACTQLTGCIFVNCNNIDDGKSYNTRDEAYPENVSTTNCFLRDVTLMGTYKAKRDSENDPYYLTEEMQNYLGCGVYADRMYFLYSDFTNIKVRNLYAGIYGGSGANQYRIYAAYCRYAVYGGGRNNMFEVSGHSGYYTSAGVTTGTTDYDCYVTGHNNTFKVRVFDVQYNISGKSAYFSPLSHDNTYDIGAPAGSGWNGGAPSVVDHGSVNKCIGDYKLVPFATGQRLRNITGYSEHRYADGTTANAIAGAGIWGNITSNKEWVGITSNNGPTEVTLSLADVCRYPKDITYYNDNEAYVRTKSEDKPSAENPITITIDLEDRPIISNGGVWIQFDYRYVAKAFTVKFYSQSGEEYAGHAITVNNNRKTLWSMVPVPRGVAKIHKIVITFTEALQIEELKWEDANNAQNTTDYNPNGIIGIVNIGAISNEPYGRAFLGECGGSLYGEVNMHGNTFKNLPNPTDDGDAVSKSYVDAQVGDIETSLDNIILIQSTLIGGDSE